MRALLLYLVSAFCLSAAPIDGGACGTTGTLADLASLTTGCVTENGGFRLLGAEGPAIADLSQITFTIIIDTAVEPVRVLRMYLLGTIPVGSYNIRFEDVVPFIYQNTPNEDEAGYRVYGPDGIVAGAQAFEFTVLQETVVLEPRQLILDDIRFYSIPEPSPFALCGTGLLLAAFLRHRQEAK